MSEMKLGCMWGAPSSHVKGFRVEVSLQLPGGVQDPLFINMLWEEKEVE